MFLTGYAVVNDWWKVRGEKLYKTGEMRRKWGRLNWLLSFFLSSFFLLAGWVLLSDSSVSQTEFPCSCSSFIPIDHTSGGVMEGVVNVEQGR